MVRTLNKWWIKFLLSKSIIKIGNRFVRLEKFTYKESIDFIFLVLPYLKTVLSLKEEYRSKGDGLLFYEIAKNYITQMNSDDLMKASALLFGLTVKEVSKIPIGEIQKNLYLAFLLRDAIKVYYLFQTLGVFNV